MKRGFTLIELLAVIILLSIIALITVPTIMNIIEKAKKSSFKDSAYGIIKAGELSYSKKLLDPNSTLTDMAFTFPEAEGLEIKGTKPKSGTMIINTEGKVSLSITDGKYCAKKDYSDDNITITDNVEDCKETKKAMRRSMIVNKLITDLKVSETNIELNLNESRFITATISPSDATNKSLTWMTENPSIVIVEVGKVTGLSKGTTKITVEAMDGSNIRKEINITVK